MKQKLLSLLLSIAMCLSLLPMAAMAAEGTYQTVKIPINGSDGTFELTLHSAYQRNTDVYMYDDDPVTGDKVSKTFNLPMYFLEPGSTVDCPKRIGYEMFGKNLEYQSDGAYFMHEVSDYNFLQNCPVEELFQSNSGNIDFTRIAVFDPETEEMELVCYLAMGNGPLASNTSTNVDNYQEMTLNVKNAVGECSVKLQSAYMKNMKLNMNLGDLYNGEYTGVVDIPIYYLAPGSAVEVSSDYHELDQLGKDNNAYVVEIGCGGGPSRTYTTDEMFFSDDPLTGDSKSFEYVGLRVFDDEENGTYFFFALGTSNDCSGGHTPASAWSSDATGHWHICTVCNEKVDSASHNYGAWTTTKEATATAAGSRERACTICGYKQTETIPATGGGSGSSGGSIGGGSVVTPPTEEKKDDEQPTPTTSFTDIPANVWYNEAVSFVTEKGLMSGTGNDTFAPGDNLTRAMLAQILYNNENKPSTSGGNFTDVQSGAWYADAITWASQTGIVSGYGNGQFGPNDNITREQLAVILWRYAGQPTSNASLTGFTDIGKASDYTLTALQWAVEKGIISGKGNGTLDPTGNATRAEVAQMLMNYFK